MEPNGNAEKVRVVRAPRRFAGAYSETSAIRLGRMPPVPNPIRKRNAASTGSEGAKAVNSENTANSSVAMITGRLRPHPSASGPSVNAPNTMPNGVAVKATLSAVGSIPHSRATDGPASAIDCRSSPSSVAIAIAVAKTLHCSRLTGRSSMKRATSTCDVPAAFDPDTATAVSAVSAATLVAIDRRYTEGARANRGRGQLGTRQAEERCHAASLVQVRLSVEQVVREQRHVPLIQIHAQAFVGLAISRGHEVLVRGRERAHHIGRNDRASVTSCERVVDVQVRRVLEHVERVRSGESPRGLRARQCFSVERVVLRRRNRLPRRRRRRNNLQRLGGLHVLVTRIE